MYEIPGLSWLAQILMAGFSGFIAVI